MKTLDQIINNENYTRLNGALIDRSVELAEKIRKAMSSAKIKDIGDYSIRTVRSNSGFSNTALYISSVIEDEYGYHNFYLSLETTDSDYFCNDFNCYIRAAKGHDRLKFLNDAKWILEEIDKIKEERVKKIEAALEATKEL
jgi:hypothetical protein